MKIGIVGSRNAPPGIAVKVIRQLPADTTEIVSGGADGVDAAAEELAALLALPLRRFLPDYAHFGKAAPLRRNMEIVEYADTVLAFWDGQSPGTRQIITECIRRGKPVQIIRLDGENGTDPDEKNW